VRLAPSRLAACSTLVRTGSSAVLLALVTCSIPSDVQEDGKDAVEKSLSLAQATSSADVIIAAGDIAKCEKTTDEQTAKVVDSLLAQYPRATVAPLGDLVYPAGTAQAFANCYTPSWGRFRSKTRPVVGSHEYDAPDEAATDYFDYFNGLGVNDGKAGPRGKGYYSWNPNEYWHVIVINSNSPYVPTKSGSAQDSWLAADLAANNRPCILAMWHHPRFYSQPQGPLNPSPGYTTPLWNRLYAAGADVILNASQHQYERFARQRPDGTADPQGIRQFIVGTGGASGASFGAIEANSEVRGNTLGVLNLTLGPGSYSWSYASIPSKPFTDKGTNPCHGGSTPAENLPPAASFSHTCTGLSCSFANTSTDSDGSVVGSTWTFGDGQGSSSVSPSHTYAAAGTYQVKLTVRDDDGATDAESKSVTVSSGTNPPPPSGIALTASGRQDATTQYMTLDWTGAQGTTVDVYRNGARITTTANDGHYVNTRVFTGTASYIYKVCQAGSTTCSNTATVEFGGDSSTDNTAPTTDFGSTCSGLACAFADGSSDPDGSVVSWSWAFGDGATSTAQNPTRTYAAAGTYSVGLTVTDNAGATGQRSKSVTVTAPTGITLTVSGRSDATTQYMTLDWTGARGTSVDVYRNGAKISVQANDGHYVNTRAFTGPATYIYKLCEAGTTVCSNQATVEFQ
jgi:PKD repeat protein